MRLKRALFRRPGVILVILAFVVGTYQVGMFVLFKSPLTTNGATRKDASVAAEDMCQIAEAVRQRPLLNSLYFIERAVEVPSEKIPHVTSVLCHRLSSSSNNNNVTSSTTLTGPSQSILVFKTARSGSHFVTEVMNNTLSSIPGYSTSFIMEPFGMPSCNSDLQPADLQADVLRQILSMKCGWVSREYLLKCRPNRYCQALDENTTEKHISMSAVNPHFLNPTLDWNQVFSSSSSSSSSSTKTTAPQNPRVINLRRTDLLRMAYSSFHLIGCGPQMRPSKSNFTLQVLLSCAQYFTLVDQELATSTAFQASQAIGMDPFIVLYEDTLQAGPLMQKQLFQFLRYADDVSHLERAGNVFTEKTSRKKEHSRPFCENEDVDCELIQAGLLDQYPCLYKQLLDESGRAWSVPMLPNGTIDIRGDCIPLRPLDERGHALRDISELYRLPL